MNSSQNNINNNQNVNTNNNVSNTQNVNVNNNGVNNNQATNQSNINPTPQVITPVIDAKEINTKKSSNSNVFFFIMLFLIIGVVVFSDKILNFITDNEYNIINKNINSSSNLINGYIKINDPDNFMLNNNIKFYNFRTSSNNIIFNYMPQKDISNVNKLNIYIELYNSNEELIDVIKFDENEKLESNIVTSYNIYVDAYIYKNAYYAKINTYDKTISRSLTCTNNIDNGNINFQYKVTYNFEYFDLKSYQVDKSIKYNILTTDADKYIKEIKNDYDTLTKFNINSNYNEKENDLSYAIDLNTVSEGYNALYKKGDNYYYIKNNEELKKWTCK